MPLAATEISEWSDLFVASAGATAALAGLVFVAISINIDRILKLEGVAELGLITLILLVGVLVVSLFGLIPGQEDQWRALAATEFTGRIELGDDLHRVEVQ